MLLKKKLHLCGIYEHGTGGSRLSQIFWEHENQSGLLVIQLIYIKLYSKMENKFWKKSGLSGNPAQLLYGLSGTHLEMFFYCSNVG